VVLSIGTNDAKNFHSGKRFCKEFGTLIYALRTRFPNARIIWSGIIDIGDIPALPFPLNRILSIRSRILMQAGKTLCEERGALAPPSGWQPLPENFAEDGFHCSAKGYGMWAKELAGFIAKMEISEATPKG
jgi:lysophospholipase L1-like esterase